MARRPFSGALDRTARVAAASAAALIVLAASALSAQAGPRPAASAPAPRAMWLWSQAAPAQVVGWATAQGVGEVFAYVPDPLPGAALTRLRELKRRCDAAGIRLAALGGDPDWTFDHAAALAWQRTALGTGLFATAHVDVEPYLLPAWRDDQAGTVAAFTALLTALAADPRPLEADVPFWYGTIPAGSGGTLADAVLDRVDAVTVMSYRDTATGPGSIMDVGADMLARGARAGRPVRLAAETAPLADCPRCTFHQEGRRALTAALRAVDAAAAGNPAFAGIAVHDHDSWRALRP